MKEERAKRIRDGKKEGKKGGVENGRKRER